MDSIKDFLQSIYDSYRDRIKSPFVGSFVISFFIFNWRAFAILFYSEWPIHCRIEWVEEHFYKQGNFWYPVLITLFYILILPYIHLFFDWVLSIYSNKKLLKKNKSRASDLETQKEEAKLLREIADAQAGTSEISNLTLTVKNLTDEINTLTERHQKEVDRLKISESKSNELITDLDAKYLGLNKENKSLKNIIENAKSEAEEKLIPDFIKSILNTLTLEEKNYFLELCDFEIFRTRNRMSPKEAIFLKLNKLELFEGIDLNEYRVKELTEKGKYVYHILKNTL